ncbi:MAG: DegT/DnrJ/EryC1/StrS family aminotransferase [Candidatus Aminicenantes bacterium]|nr:MAG: DegT/DnrJ/EryC1/StrS family aminotransferase [Candidatus Aminicenantes bacterium]
MIPRYAPTYTFNDLLNGLKQSSDPDIENKLIARLKSYYNVRHAFLFGSGREALYAVLKAYNRPGGVLIPAYNCIVVPEAIQFAGYRPVFVDIERNSLCMTAENVKKSLSSDVQAVFLTHIFGIPCEIQEILDVLIKQNKDILIVEDAAPAIGAEYNGQVVGSFGDASVISFQSTKVISGEIGGALLTNNENLAEKLKGLKLEAVGPGSDWMLFIKALARKFVTSRNVYELAQFGYRTLRGEKMYEIVPPKVQKPKGFLSRCPSFSCALVFLQLDRLRWNLERRRNLALIYQNELSKHTEVSLPEIAQACDPAWIQYPILVDDKLSFYKHMQRNQIDVSWTYRYSCAESFGIKGFPNSIHAAETIIGLPTSPFISDEQAMEICRVANQFRGR